MDQNSFLNRLETLGYYPLPRSHADSPGYSGLLVVLRRKPQGHEPDKIQLRLHDWDDKTSIAYLHAEMDRPFSHVICPGRIIIHSRQEREVTFYSFGGSIESEVLESETVYSLRSAAPVLELVPKRKTIADLLADETEILFARAKAQQQLSTEELLDRLTKAGPEALYLAVLQTLLSEIEAGENSKHSPNFANMLTDEQTWYQKRELWPKIERDLATLLQAMGES